MHYILFNIDSHMESKYSQKINHIIFSNIHNSYIGIMALQNHSFANIAHIATMWIFHSQIYISHMLKARISLTNLLRRNCQISSSFRELEHHHLIHLVHIMVQLLMVLKHVINALNLSYTCICQKCNAWTIFLMFKFSGISGQYVSFWPKN